MVSISKFVQSVHGLQADCQEKYDKTVSARSEMNDSTHYLDGKVRAMEQVCNLIEKYLER